MATLATPTPGAGSPTRSNSNNQFSTSVDLPSPATPKLPPLQTADLAVMDRQPTAANSIDAHQVAVPAGHNVTTPSATDVSSAASTLFSAAPLTSTVTPTSLRARHRSSVSAADVSARPIGTPPGRHRPQSTLMFNEYTAASLDGTTDNAQALYNSAGSTSQPQPSAAAANNSRASQRRSRSDVGLLAYLIRTADAISMPKSASQSSLSSVSAALDAIGGVGGAPTVAANTESSPKSTSSGATRKSRHYSALMRMVPHRQTMSETAIFAAVPLAESLKTPVVSRRQQEQQELLRNTGANLLADVTRVGYGVVMGHPVLQLYMLMCCVQHGSTPLMFFRASVAQFQQLFAASSTPSNQLHRMAYRVYQTFLSDGATLPLRSALFKNQTDDAEQLALYTVLVEDVLKRTAEPSAPMFSALDQMVAQELQRMYGDPAFPMPDTFLKGAQYQAMMQDLAGQEVLSDLTVDRIVCRVLDLGAHLLNAELHRNITQLLDSLCIQWRKLAPAAKFLSVGSASPVTKLNKAAALLGLSSVAASAPDMSLASSASSSRSDSSPSLASTTGGTISLRKLSAGFGKMSGMAAAAYSGPNADHDQHPFVALNRNHGHLFCELCFEPFDAASDAGGAMYRCEICQYVCHKSCRRSVGVPCLTSEPVEKVPETPLDPVNVKLAIDKLASIRTELSLTEKLKDGLERIKSASGGGSGSHGGGSNTNGSSGSSSKPKKEHRERNEAAAATMHTTTKKLQFLAQKEMIYLTQLALFASIFQFSATPPAEMHMENERVLRALLHPFVTGLLDFVRVRVQIIGRDEAQGCNYTLVIDPATTARDVIGKALAKRRASIGNDEAIDYTLSLQDCLGDEHLLDDDAFPAVIVHMLKEPVFFVKSREKPAIASSGSSGALIPVRASKHQKQARISMKLGTPDAMIDERRLAVLKEIFDTEQNYTNTLNMAITHFLVPLQLGPSPPSIQDIFSNITELHAVHSRILQECGGNPLQLVSALHTNLPQLAAVYPTYCSNQNNSQRQLARLKATNENFVRFLKAAESARDLERRSLADLLIQPMQRLTRYPILLKRLMDCTPISHAAFTSVRVLHKELEVIAGKVDAVVCRREGQYRLHQIHHNLDWNNLCDPVSLITPASRRLVSEKPMRLLTKKGASYQSQETLAVVFTDLLLLIHSHRKKDHETLTLLRPPVKFVSMALVSVSNETNDSQLSNCVQVVAQNQDVYLLQMMSRTDKLAWMKDVEACVIACRYRAVCDPFAAGGDDESPTSPFEDAADAN